MAPPRRPQVPDRLRGIAPRVSGLEFGSPVPMARGWQRDVSTVVSGSPTTLSFDVFEFSPDYFDISAGGSPATFQTVDCLVSGLYAIHFETEFDVALASTVRVGMAVEEGGVFTESPVVVYPATPLAGDLTSGHYSMDIIRGYPPIWVHSGDTSEANGPTTPTLKFNLVQDSGSNKNSSLAMFEIYLLGALSVDTSPILEV